MTKPRRDMHVTVSLVITLACVLSACQRSIQQSDFPALDGVPANVAEIYLKGFMEYTAAQGENGTGFGRGRTGIGMCTKNEETLYYIGSSHSMGGSATYFDVSGNAVGSNIFTDTGSTKEVDIEGFTCTGLTGY